jgi:cyclohexadieny/prephenate dehydrogenase
MFQRITIIGLGLIGSSIARAAHEKKLGKTIVGCDRNEVSLAYARKHGFIDSAEADPAEAVAGSDLVILAAPPSALEELAAAIAPHLAQGALVMDVSSVKQAAIEAVAPHIPAGVTYMPAHPIAGSEHSGISAGRADLFERKRVVITPSDPNDLAVPLVTAFWHSMGGHVEGMPAHLHDLIYAYVSHLPQLLAFAAARQLEQVDSDGDELLQKFLRLSNSSPTLWVDIFLMNRANLLAALDRYLDVVKHIIAELGDAPEDEPTAHDQQMARIALFPRIAASCLITTVMEAEKKAGFSFARYAGTGFADFTYAASQPPEEDIERISAQYQSVIAILVDYADAIKTLRRAIDTGSEESVQDEITL